jgi:2-keto-4-pentenoate hydratase/2-oxohepta-3-ene-1,7-dioic acid hydratase in catechol pathway
MKLITFYPDNSDSTFRVGMLLNGERIADLTHFVSGESLTATDVLRCFDLDGEFMRRVAGISAADKFDEIDLKSVRLAAPVPRPPKIICIGLNYRNHAIESGMDLPKSPIIFSKFSSCAIGVNQPIVLPKNSSQVDYETELAFIIGRAAKNVSAADAMRYVFGYTNFNDVSARDFQFADGQWQRGKSCDTFAPFGPFATTKDEISDPHNLRIRFRLNGETLQDSNTNELIFKIPELIEFLSASITLEPGDIVATGTPPGVGFARKPPVYMKGGDIAEVEIEGLGILSNPVMAGLK